MWGNLTGWIISAVLAVVLGGMLYLVATPQERWLAFLQPSASDPTNSAKLAIAYKEIVPPIGPETVVALGTKDCDAGDLYRKAIEDYQVTSSAFDKFKTDKMAVGEKQLSPISHLLAARDCRSANIFANKTDISKVLNYDNTEPPLEALKDMGETAITLGMMYVNKPYCDAKFGGKLQTEKAVKLWEAAFLLGFHMYDERVCWAEYVTGHGLMQDAASNLEKHYREKNDTAKADKIKDFKDAEGDQALKLTEAFKIIGGIQEAPTESYVGVGIYAGDIYKIARSPTADKMLRAEALKHIGNYRFNSVSRGDQLAAQKVLKEMVDDGKLPMNVKAAANAANDLTIEKHNMIGGA